MILHFVIVNRTEHHRLVRYNWEGQLTEISLSKINDNDISQNEIRQKILLVKYLSTMHKISSKFSPRNSRMEKFDLEIGEIYIAEQTAWWIVETLFIVFRIEIWGSSLLLLRLVPKDGNETFNSYHDFLPKSRTLWEKKMLNFLLKNFPKYPFFDSPSTSDTISNLHLQNFLHRLIKTKKKRNVQFHETSHRDRRRWLRIEDIQGGKGSSLLIWKKNDFEKEAEEEPWKKKTRRFEELFQAVLAN